MSRPRGLFLAVIVVCNVTGCLLYTDPINMPPEITKITRPDTIYRGQSATFTAVVEDPDQSAGWEFAWGQAPGKCPKSEGSLPLKVGTGVFVVVPQKAEDFCVCVRATDKYGAAAWKSLDVTAENRIPTAAIEVLSPARAASYDLYSDFRLSGAPSRDLDHDSLTYKWLLTLPGGQMAAAKACDGAQVPAAEICFWADAPGEYRADLQVSDGLVDSNLATETIVVAPDRPPCIRAAEPDFMLARLVRDPGGVTAFAVTVVDDDGDKFPAILGHASGSSQFVWSYRNGMTGGFDRVTGHNVATYGFSAGAFHTGDVVQVRVEYHDRIERDFSACRAAGPARCELVAGSGCYQWVTWTVEYSL